MRSGDGGIWRLRWSVKDGVYTGFVVGHPSVKASGKSFAELDDALCDAVSEKLQGGEWTADWDPLPPSEDSAVGSTLSTHVILSGEGRFVSMMAPDDVYTSYCGACGLPTGPRTKRELEVFVESTANLCFDFGSAPGRINIYSLELAELLARIPGATEQIEIRPCRRLGRGRKQFCEILPKASLNPPRSQWINVKPDWSSLCPDCGQANNYVSAGSRQPAHYYLSHDLPSTDGLFCVSPTPEKLEVCVPVAWWRVHMKAAACRGVISGGVGVINKRIDATGQVRRSATELASFNRHARSWKSRQAYYAENCGLQMPIWS